ncbi:MAG: ThiF family adenylyltransferase [Deltaproteobacteria bacterium]|nr:ThiF family adenylyltransferase [Deltaproteobacteria bacterium]
MDHTRHIGIFDASKLSISLVGCGGIGATAAITLAKMGVAHLALYDDDAVDEVNIATQLHRISDIGKNKALALEEVLSDYADTEVVAVPRRVSYDTPFHTDIVISAVDSIHARHNIWAAVKTSRPDWYLDARMASELFQLYTVNMQDQKFMDTYASQLLKLSDESVTDEPCTAKATMFTGFMAAGHIGRAIRMIATRKPVKFLSVHNILEDSLFGVA